MFGIGREATAPAPARAPALPPSISSIAAAARPDPARRPASAWSLARRQASTGAGIAAFLAEQLGQPADMRREPTREGIDPLRARDEQLERRRRARTSARRTTKIGFCLLTARSTSRATKSEPFDAFDSTRHERLGALDAPDDLVAVGAPRLHVARRDPAFEPALLEARRRSPAPSSRRPWRG